MNLIYKRPTIFKFGLSWWAPYFGTGISVQRIAPDYSSVTVQMKQRWYNRNAFGTHFGGSNLDWTSFSPPLISDDGSVVFAANFGVGAISTDRGIWSDRKGSLDLVVRTGDQAPGTPAGTR